MTFRTMAVHLNDVLEEKRSGPGEPPDGNPIVSMVEHRGRLVLATTRHIYELRDGVWHPVLFAPPQRQE